MHVDEYKIINIYNTPPTRLQMFDLLVFPHPRLYSGDLNSPHTSHLVEDKITIVLTGIAWLHGQTLTIYTTFITQRTLLASIQAAGTLSLTKILLSVALVLIIAYSTDVLQKSSLGHNVDPRSSFQLGLPFLSLESPLSAETFARQTRATDKT